MTKRRDFYPEKYIWNYRNSHWQYGDSAVISRFDSSFTVNAQLKKDWHTDQEWNR